MTDDHTAGGPPDDYDGPERRTGSRARHWAGRVKAVPSRLEWLYANQADVNESLRVSVTGLASLAERLDELERRAEALDRDNRAGVTAVGDEIHRLRGDLEARIDAVDQAVASHAQTLRRAIATPARDAEKARLLTELGAAPERRPGLSVFTLCWNHGGLLAKAVRSGLEVLDARPTGEAGQVLVFDDASSDETPRVAAELAAHDERVRVITARTNLGLARARNVLLHTTPTTHAFQLDADNTATPDGVAALYAVATTYGSAFTYGNVIKHDAAGEVVGLMSNEPLSEPWFRMNYIDTMGVVDVDRLGALGGWPEDPAIEHVDDWAVVHRMARAGELIGFVPVVVGRYLTLDHAFHLSVPDLRIGPDQVVRAFNPDGRLGPDTVASFAAHPDLGPLWASPAALALRPDLAPPPRSVPAVPDRPRLLVIGPGGVANLGDDAIVAAALDHLRKLAPNHDIDVITDGPEPTPLGPRAVWMGPLVEAVRGLRSSDLATDDELGAAVEHAGVGTEARRPVEPSDYEAAVFLGGGSLTSLWGDTLVSPRAVLAAALRQAGVPYAASGQGVGPLDEGDTVRATSLLRGATRVAVRNDRSADAVPGVTTETTGDDALLLAPPDAGVVEAALERAGVADRFLAITVREADYVGGGSDQLASWAAAVDELAFTRDLTVVGVALNEQPGQTEVASLARLAHGGVARRSPWRIVECGTDPHLLAGVMAAADAAVVHSYHAALFALAASVPAVLMSHSPYYEQKANGLATLAGLPDAFTVSAGDDLALGNRLDLVAKALASGTGLTPATAAVRAWWAGTIAALVTPTG